MMEKLEVKLKFVRAVFTETFPASRRLRLGPEFSILDTFVACSGL